jgi:SAM-dependent methyltransferase
MNEDWKKRVYARYVSSGNMAIRTDPVRYFAPRQPYIQKVIRQHLPTNKNIRILDLGCGHGAFIYFLQQNGYQNVQGVDGSAEQVALAHRLGISAVEQQDIFLYISRVKKETVDAIILMDVLEHLTRQELFDLLDEIYRVLRIGGKCIIHVPNASGLYGMHIRYGDLTHEMAFTLQSARQVFSAVGFNNINCFEEIPIIHGVVSFFRWLLWSMGTLPSRLLLAVETGDTAVILSQNMLVIAVKPIPISKPD